MHCELFVIIESKAPQGNAESSNYWWRTDFAGVLTFVSAMERKMEVWDTRNLLEDDAPRPAPRVKRLCWGAPRCFS